MVKNNLQSFRDKKNYFISEDKFKLKDVKVGPLPKGKKIILKICNFINNNFDIKNNMLVGMENKEPNDKMSYYEISFHPELIIHSDIKINFQGIVNFYIWVNLWYVKKRENKLKKGLDEIEKRQLIDDVNTIAEV